MHVAVIPARGSSKRIPRKNIKLFHGKPMITRAIQIALESDIFEYVIVSTDDEEIADIALESGAIVPFVRPPELSDDYAATAPVIAHSVRHCIEKGWDINDVCCIYPGTPFVLQDDLRKTHALLKKNIDRFVYPVAEYSHPIQRALKLTSNGFAEFYMDGFELSRTQDLEVTYHDAGQFYWGTAELWLKGIALHSQAVCYPIPAWRVVDIDTEDDWRRAELLYKVLKEI